MHQTVTCQDLVSMFSPIRRRSRAVTATMPSRGEISSGVWTRQPPAPARVAVLPNSVRGVILRDGGNDQNDQEDSKFTGGTRLHFWRGCNCREHGLIAPDPFSRCRHSHLIVRALAARPETGRATGGCFPPQGPFRSRAARCALREIMEVVRCIHWRVRQYDFLETAAASCNPPAGGT